MALIEIEKIAKGLRKAYCNLVTDIEQCYCLKPFENNHERLEYLFGVYEEMSGKGKV